MSKDEHFVITLKNDRLKNYIRLGYLLTAINFVPFILFLFFRESRIAGLTGVIATILYFVIRFFIVKRKQAKYYLDENIFFILAAAWLLQSSLMAVLILITGILFKISLQPLRFIFREDFIEKDFFPKKKIDWEALQIVVQKDGILTLDFKDNRLLQAPVENYNQEVEVAFNEFAQKMKDVHQVQL